MPRVTPPLEAFIGELRRGLEERRRAGLHRRPQLSSGIDLTSNDYLGFASDPELAARIADLVRTHGAGTGGSRLLSGHRALFDDLEQRLAELSGRPRALTFSSGYAANVGMLPALIGRRDTVLSDAYNHASLIDGLRLTRAKLVVYPHQDLDRLAAELSRPREGRAFIVTESVFSMDGDLTDLETLCALAEAHDALVIVDEAHATGLFGSRGSGRVEALGLERRILATTHTGGKALGVGGAWIAAEADVVDHLVNHCRSFIYTTAPIPALAAGLLSAVELLGRAGDRVADLHRKASQLRDRLRAGGADLGTSESQIIPIIVGPSQRALDLAAGLREDGFDVRAVRPPTVPQGAARIRVTVRAPVPDETLERFAGRVLHHLGR